MIFFCITKEADGCSLLMKCLNFLSLIRFRWLRIHKNDQLYTVNSEWCFQTELNVMLWSIRMWMFLLFICEELISKKKMRVFRFMTIYIFCVYRNVKHPVWMGCQMLLYPGRAKTSCSQSFRMTRCCKQVQKQFYNTDLSFWFLSSCIFCQQISVLLEWLLCTGQRTRLAVSAVLIFSWVENLLVTVHTATPAMKI